MRSKSITGEHINTYEDLDFDRQLTEEDFIQFPRQKERPKTGHARNQNKSSALTATVPITKEHLVLKEGKDQGHTSKQSFTGQMYF